MKGKGLPMKSKEWKQKHSSHDESIIFGRKFPYYVELEPMVLLQREKNKFE